MENTPEVSSSKYLMPASIVLAGLFIGGAVFWNGQHPVQLGTGQAAAGTAVNIKNVKADGEPFYGKADAKVVIAFWSDFQCPYCKSFEVGGVPGIPTAAAMPDIIKNYVDTGKAKIVFKDFAFLGADSLTAAEYGRAIWKLYPDQYFVWRTAMYKAQDDEGDKGFGDAPSIDKLNKTVVGLDSAKIAADVVANKAAYDKIIDANKAEGQSMGVSATPSFIIGKQLIAGAYPFLPTDGVPNSFKAAIDAALAGK